MRTIEQLRSKLRQFGEQTPESPVNHEEELMTKVWNLEEERNLLRNELEGQQVHWQAQLETEQRQSTAALAKLKEERDLADRDRELKRKVEDSLAETQRTLKSTRQAGASIASPREGSAALSATVAGVLSAVCDSSSQCMIPLRLRSWDPCPPSSASIRLPLGDERGNLVMPHIDDTAPGKHLLCRIAFQPVRSRQVCWSDTRRLP